MREIKFRGLRTDGKGWVYGNLLSSYTDTDPFSEESEFIVNTCIQVNPNLFEKSRLCIIIPESVSQFIGLKDKNGVEIYENDIVKCMDAEEPEEKGFVCIFKDYRYKFNNVNFLEDDFYGTVNYEYISKKCEVIGNIYENPELLK